jgi:hypothetical protein
MSFFFTKLSYTNPKKLLFEFPHPNLLPMEKGLSVNLLGLVLILSKLQQGHTSIGFIHVTKMLFCYDVVLRGVPLRLRHDG